MQVNVIITNKDFPKVVFKKKTVILDSQLQRTLFHGNHYCRNRLVIRSICKTRLVTHSTRLTTSSTGTVVLCLLTCSTHLSVRNTRLSISLSIAVLVCLLVVPVPLNVLCAFNLRLVSTGVVLSAAVL